MNSRFVTKLAGELRTAYNRVYLRQGGNSGGKYPCYWFRKEERVGVEEEEGDCWGGKSLLGGGGPVFL